MLVQALTYWLLGSLSGGIVPSVYHAWLGKGLISRRVLLQNSAPACCGSRSEY